MNNLAYLLEEPEEQTPAIVEQYNLDVLTSIASRIKKLNERHDKGEIDARGFNYAEKKPEGEDSDIVFQGYLLAEFILAKFGGPANG